MFKEGRDEDTKNREGNVCTRKDGKRWLDVI